MARRSKIPKVQRPELVLAVLRGTEKLEVLARRHQVSANTLRRWRDEFLAGGRERLMGTGDSAAVQDENKRLQRDLAEREMIIGELTVANRFLQKKVDGSNGATRTGNSPGPRADAARGVCQRLRGQPTEVVPVGRLAGKGPGERGSTPKQNGPKDFSLKPVARHCTVNSEPLSDRRNCGTLRVANSQAKHSSTSSDESRRATSIDRHSRLYSSTNTSIRSGRSSWVRSCTRSYAHTWSWYADRSRIHDPSLSHNRPRFGCFLGTLRPSRRHNRSTRLWLTRQPSCRSSVVIRR